MTRRQILDNITCLYRHFDIYFVDITTYNTTSRGPKTFPYRGNFVVLSFRRALTNATKRTNEEMKFHFFVLATYTTRQNERTKKWNFVVAFCRLFVFVTWPTRQNEQTKKWNSFSSFWRLVQRDKTKKRRNEILFWRSVVCSFSWLDQREKPNKRRNEIPFLRFGDLYNATKRTNEEMKFCFGVLSFVRVKKTYLIIYSQLILKYSDDLSWFTVVIYYF